MINDTNILYTL